MVCILSDAFVWSFRAPLFVELRIKGIEIPAVEIILHDAEAFAETLIVHDLTLS